MLQLPHTTGCLVCGRDNPHGLKLDLFVNEKNDTVSTEFTPEPHHIGFDRVVHGGVIATVLDEAMVWAATWRGRRFCLCGELTVRFRSPAVPGQLLRVEAMVEFSRPKLVETVGKVFDATGKLLATSSAKYVPISAQQHQLVTETFAVHPETTSAADILRSGK